MNGSWLFETSWEVCNKVGGIHTVITSKAAQAMEAFGDRYAAIGPLLGRNPGFEPCDPPSGFAAALARLAQKGVRVEAGRWGIPGRPWVLLVDFHSAVPAHDKLLFQLWNDYGVDSMTGGWDYIEPVLFSTAAAMVVKELADDLQDAGTEPVEVFGHFHEWMCGAGVLYLKKHAPSVSTVMTTHATMLGRAMSGSGVDIYRQLEEIDPSVSSKQYGVAAKHCMESVSAREADCFTTVSNITRKEAAHLLGTNPAVVTVNGFNLEDFAEPGAVANTRTASRQQLVNLASRFLERELDPEKTLLLATSGRYEFHNKGIDLLIDSLARLDHELAEAGDPVTVVAFLLVSCGYAGFSDEARRRLKEETYGIEKYAGIATHHLGDPEHDPIVGRCRERRLDNRVDNRCCVIFIPVYLDGNDGILNLEYYDALAGMDLTVFPSFYEPWGYTPMESAAFAVPTVTSDRAGFGQWVMERHPEGHPGVLVLNRLEHGYDETVERLTAYLGDFTRWDAQERAHRAQQARSVAEEATWEQFHVRYVQAYDTAAEGRAERISGVQRMTAEPGREVSFTGVNTTQPRLRSITVVTELPQALARLRELADNLWWVWHRDAQELFERLDAQRWTDSGHNPVRLLETMDRERLNELAGDIDFMGHFSSVLERFDTYMEQAETANHEGVTWDNPISYFSMEFGLHESIPIYSGGLGLLAGDHIKSASDLNLPFVGVSLLYKNGYFHQRINGSGEQVVEYRENDFAAMPVNPLHHDGDERTLVTVDLPGRTVFAQIWVVGVGRAKLYLLDTDVEENSRTDRDIANRLYEPSSKGRIEQEIVLGVGGVRMLKALGIEPCLYHLNEGHSAFLLFERIRQLMLLEGVDFDTAKEIVRGATVFTMHTPVPAGNEVFERSLVENYFRGYAEEMGVPWDALWNMGRMYSDQSDHLNMTVLALHLSSARNGVSRLHGDVSRGMWMDLWRGLLRGEVPIGYITNGVHVTTWLDERLRRDIETQCSLSVHERLLAPDDWACFESLDDRTLWETHTALKHRLYDEVRRSVSAQWTREGEPPNRLRAFLENLDPDRLTLCFARRSTAYKRPTLLFHDLKKVSEIFCNPDRPVNIIFAGKAHPADTLGASFISLISRLAKQDDFLGRVVFLESYDIRLARLLVSGADVWLNNPTRLMEASGTSGMKAAANGVPNCSILDGWWDEAFDGTNGWAVGRGEVYENQVNQDIVDADHLYEVLETSVVPEFYDRDAEGLPRGWLARMKRAMRTAFGQYGTHRMLREYVTDMYRPVIDVSQRRNADDHALAREIGEWRKRLPGRFSTVSIREVRVLGVHGDVTRLGGTLHVSARVDRGQMGAGELLVELVTGTPAEDAIIDTVAMTPVASTAGEGEESGVLEFRADYAPSVSGSFRYGVRVIPVHPGLASKYETHMIRWS